MNALLIAATAIHIGWTAPPQPVSGYVGFRSWDHGAHYELMRLWSDSALTIPYQPGAQGAPTGAWIWTDYPYRNDMVGKIIAYNFYGSSNESNRIIISTGLPDTVLYLVRGYLPSGLPVLGQSAWPRNGGGKDSLGATLAPRAVSLTQGWSLAVGDSAAYEVMTFEDVVRRPPMWSYIRNVNGGRYPMWGLENPYPLEAKK
jgi:hypothetical protein